MESIVSKNSEQGELERNYDNKLLKHWNRGIKWECFNIVVLIRLNCTYKNINYLATIIENVNSLSEITKFNLI